MDDEISTPAISRTNLMKRFMTVFGILYGTISILIVSFMIFWVVAYGSKPLYEKERIYTDNKGVRHHESVVFSLVGEDKTDFYFSLPGLFVIGYMIPGIILAGSIRGYRKHRRTK